MKLKVLLQIVAIFGAAYRANAYEVFEQRTLEYFPVNWCEPIMNTVPNESDGGRKITFIECHDKSNKKQEIESGACTNYQNLCDESAPTAKPPATVMLKEDWKKNLDFFNLAIPTKFKTPALYDSDLTGGATVAPAAATAADIGPAFHPKKKKIPDRSE